MINQIETRLAPLARQLKNGQLTPTTYLQQLEPLFDAENARIEAFLPEENRFQRLYQQAGKLEARYPDPARRPPLYGVPVGIKDIFHVDGFLTRAGSSLPPEVITNLEARCVTQLKEAGALILGKTVTTEFAYFAPGPTRNPHNVDHTPGGSSSGSAAAVAAGLTPLALGSQTIGSIIRPAAYCGIIGYKPTMRRIASEGMVPLSPALDTVGYFTRDLEGLQLAASVLCKDWVEISASNTKPTLGIPAGPYLDKATAEGREHFFQTADKLRAAGFDIKTIDAMPDFDEIVVWHNDMIAGEIARAHQEWFEEYRDLYLPKTAALIERGHQVALEAIKVYQAEREWLRSELRTLMSKNGISAWISPPATGTAPHGLNFTGDPIMNLPWTYAGVPVITVPAGAGANGLPLGLQISADCNRDEQLAHWAGQIAAAISDPA